MTYQNIDIIKAVPIETEPTTIDSLVGVRLTYMGRLSRSHQLSRIGRTLARKSLKTALRGLKELYDLTDNVLTELDRSRGLA